MNAKRWRSTISSSSCFQPHACWRRWWRFASPASPRQARWLSLAGLFWHDWDFNPSKYPAQPLSGSRAITFGRRIFRGRAIAGLAPSRKFVRGDWLGVIDRPRLLDRNGGTLEVDNLTHVPPPRCLVSRRPRFAQEVCITAARARL